MDRKAESVALEKKHVHDVYNRIAPHISDTRYKAWPRVKEFLLELEPGSIVADVGKVACHKLSFVALFTHL